MRKSCFKCPKLIFRNYPIHWLIFIYWWCWFDCDCGFIWALGRNIMTTWNGDRGNNNFNDQPASVRERNENELPVIYFFDFFAQLLCPLRALGSKKSLKRLRESIESGFPLRLMPSHCLANDYSPQRTRHLSLSFYWRFSVGFSWFIETLARGRQTHIKCWFFCLWMFLCHCVKAKEKQSIIMRK